MSTQVLILSGGRDRNLLRLRSAVLRAAGCIVVDAFTSSEVMRKFAHGDFDVVLLCHTFGDEEQTKLGER
jgi:hypothetical protein